MQQVLLQPVFNPVLFNPNPLPNAALQIPIRPPPTSRAQLGRTVLTGVAIGQDSGEMKRKKGISIDYFYVGEAVSVHRSDGRKTIAEIVEITPSGMTLDVGRGVRKPVLVAQVPLSVSKLLGAYYVDDQVQRNSS